MASNKVIFEVVATSKGFEIVQTEQQKLAASIEKTDKKTKNLNKTQERNYGRQKQGLIQTANSTKNFSKLSSTIGSGSSGLVGAYATLAANVFAATAAFSALSSAAKFEQLTEGLNQLGLQSGRSLDLLANRLKEVTGAAITTEEAFRSAALGISGGFGGTELEGLARIAKGASITLGRDLSDAFDRLTRGAIKLEPEILDELGIMVRLDDAVENYATKLGKTAGSLTQTERRQAFMNAILEQGSQKFGEIADATDPTVYDRLAATFGDLTKSVFGFVNSGLGPMLGFLADNTAVLAGTVLILGNNVAKQMLPSLSNAGAGAAAAAAKLEVMSEAATETANNLKNVLTGQLKTFKGGPKTLENFRKGLQNGNVSLNEMEGALISVRRSVGALEGKQKSANINFTAGMARNLQLRKQEQLLIEQLILAEKRKGAAQLAAAAATVKAEAAGAVADQLTLYSSGLQGFGTTLSSVNTIANEFGETLTKNAIEALPKNAKGLGLVQKGLIRSEVAGLKFANTLRLIGAAFFKLLLPIGIIIASLGVLYFAYQKIFNTPEEQKFRKGQEELGKLLDALPEKVEEFNKLNSKNLPISTKQIRQYQIISNTVSEINDKLKQQIKLQIEADKSRPSQISRNLGQDAEEAAKSAAEIFETTFNRVSTGLGTQGGPAFRIDEINPTGQKGLQQSFGDLFQFEELQESIEESKKGLANLFGIDKTDEFKSFQALIKNATPEQLAVIKKEFDLTEAAKLNGQALRRYLATTIDNVDKRIGLLGSSFADLQTAIKDGEKAASGFINSLSKKTSVDNILQSFQGIFKQAQASGDIVKENLEGSNQRALSLGRALTDVGTNVSRLLGPEFTKPYNDAKIAARELEAVTKATYETEIQKKAAIDRAQKAYDDTLITLGQTEDVLERTLSALLDQQQAELNRKQILTEINTQLKTGQQIIQKSGEGVELITTLNEKRRKLEKEQLEFQKQFVRNSFGSKIITQELRDTYGDILGTSEELNYTQIENLLIQGKYNDALKLGNELGINSENIFALQGVLQDQKNKKLKDGLDLLQEEFDKENMLQNALLNRLSISKQLVEAQKQSAELQAKVNNLITRGTSALSPQQKAKLEVEAATKALEFAVREAEIKKAIIDAEFKLLEARVDLLEREGILTEKEAKSVKKAFDESKNFSKNLIDEGVKQARLGVVLAIGEGIASQSGGLLDVANVFSASVTSGILPLLDKAKKAREIADKAAERAKNAPFMAAPTARKEAGEADAVATKAEADVTKAVDAAGMSLLTGTLQAYKASLAELGPEGELVSSVVAGTLTMISAFSQLGQTFDSIKTTMFGEDGETLKDGFTSFNVAMAEGAAVAQFAASAISAVGDILAANSRNQIAEIDKQIEAERKRDGKSKESLARIADLEKRKEAQQKKAFEQQKKIQMASVVMNAAAAIMQVWANPADLFKTWAPVMTGVITGLAAAQLAIIAKTSYAGGSGDIGGSAPQTALSIGGRSNSVDVGQQASAGELAYVRGGQGVGTNANNFTPGAAMGRKGYADGGDGITVGERGPEVITPAAPIDITPNYALGGGTTNVNFSISAVDGASVQNMLNEQQGNIIAMIRQAANDNGEGFLESVDPTVYGGTGG